MAEKDTNPRERFRNDPDPRKRFADVFINGEPVVSEPLLPAGDEVSAEKDVHDLDGPEKFLKESSRAHPMAPEDRLAEGQIQVTFIGKRPKHPKRPT